MTEVSEAALIIERAYKVRSRLLSPPNAVRDEGIDLRRKRKTRLVRMQKPPEEPEVKKLVLDAPQEPEKRQFPTSSLILLIKATAEHFGYTYELLRGTNRKFSVVFARQVACYLCRDLTGRSFPSIGALLYKDHTTIIHGYYKIKGLIETNPKVALHIQAIRILYERLYNDRPVLSTQPKQNLAVQLLLGSCPSGAGVPAMDERGPTAMAVAEADPV